MLKPKAYKEENKMTEELIAEDKKVQDILFDKNVSDEEADKQVISFNQKLETLGISTHKIITREEAKKAYPSFF